jgi:two-component system CheB/CheR fusion protein
VVRRRGNPENADAVAEPAAKKRIGSDELVRMLLNSTGEGTYGVVLEVNCTFANAACARLLGFENVDAILGRHMRKLLHHKRSN